MAIPINTPAGHVFLHVRRIAATRAIPPTVLSRMERAEISSFFEKQTGDMMLELAVRIAGKEVDKQTVTYPATWWEAFKLECLPTVCRLLKHKPRMTTHVMTAAAYYPSVHIPNHNPFVQVTQRKTH